MVRTDTGSEWAKPISYTRGGKSIAALKIGRKECYELAEKGGRRCVGLTFFSPIASSGYSGAQIIDSHGCG